VAKPDRPRSGIRRQDRDVAAGLRAHGAEPAEEAAAGIGVGRGAKERVNDSKGALVIGQGIVERAQGYCCALRRQSRTSASGPSRLASNLGSSGQALSLVTNLNLPAFDRCR
jgi:hypothetical protein